MAVLSFSVLVGVPGPPAAGAPQAAGNVLLTLGEGIEAHNSPTVVQNPADRTNLVEADRVDRPTFSAAVHYSVDGGRTWAVSDIPLPSLEDRPYAPELSFAEDGTLYLEFVTLRGPGNSPGAVWLATSRDGGATFSRPRRILGGYAFQVQLAVDRAADPDGLWLTWLQADPAAVKCPNCFTRTGLPILAAHSDDGGATWSDPVRVSPPDRARVGAAVPEVDERGDLLVLYYDFLDDRVDWENLRGRRYRGSWELVAARSEDGRTFSETVVAPVRAPDRFLPYLPPFPGLAVWGDRAYAAWHDSRNGDWDVFLAASDAAGAAWEAPVRVNDDPRGSGRHQYLPQVTVAPGGRVDVAFYDRRNDPNNVMTDVYLAASTSQGASFLPNIRVSNQSFSSEVGPEHVGSGADFGSRLGMVSADDRALVAWTDTRNGTVASARQDIVAGVVVRLGDEGPGPGLLVGALTAGVLVGVGGALLVSARLRRHSSGGG